MKIIVICTGNTCRSQIAEGLLKSKYPDAEIYSAGTYPETHVNPYAVKAMAESGYDISKQYPKLVNDFIKEALDKNETQKAEIERFYKKESNKNKLADDLLDQKIIEMLKEHSKINEKDLIKNLIYPSFASAGPFKINKNLSKIKTIKFNNNQRYYLVCIYMAFTLNFCLNYMNSSSDIILDGPLTKNNIIMGIVATLRSKQKVFSNKKQIGTSLGASLLFNIKKKSKLNLNKISILENTNYKKIYKFWIDEIKNKNLLN